MSRIKFLWPLLVVLAVVAFTTGADAQRIRGDSLPNGQFDTVLKNLRFKNAAADSVILVGDNDADTTDQVYVYGATQIAIVVETVDHSNGDTVFVSHQQSVDGNLWSSATAVDTLVTPGAFYNVVVGQNANPAVTIANTASWPLMRLIVRHGDLDAATDSTKVRNVRVRRLFESR